MKLLFTQAEIEAAPKHTLYERIFEGTPFRIEGRAFDGDKPGHWSTSIVAIFMDGNLQGGYRRTYSSFGADTFHPFQWEGVWYALYSADYTATRVLRFSESGMEDWCGEEPQAHGFCPVEYFLPRSYKTQQEGYDFVEFENSDDYKEGFSKFEAAARGDGANVEYPGFGFYCGCVWGDDGDWKLRYIDYSKVSEKILVLDDRFGYHPLPALPLKECVDLNAWEPECPLIYTTKRVRTIARPLAKGESPDQD